MVAVPARTYGWILFVITNLFFRDQRWNPPGYDSELPISHTWGSSGRSIWSNCRAKQRSLGEMDRWMLPRVRRNVSFRQESVVAQTRPRCRIFRCAGRRLLACAPFLSRRIQGTMRCHHAITVRLFWIIAHTSHTNTLAGAASEALCLDGTSCTSPIFCLSVAKIFFFALSFHLSCSVFYFLSLFIFFPLSFSLRLFHSYVIYPNSMTSYPGTPTTLFLFILSYFVGVLFVYLPYFFNFLLLVVFYLWVILFLISF